MIYLASPYSHPDPAVREQRFRDACRAAVTLMRKGRFIFSPIAHSHSLAEFGLPGDWDFWERIDREHLWRCDRLVVLMLDGWRESVGVQAEIEIAEKLGLPVEYLPPDVRDVSPTLARVAKEAEV
jgi:hypothetical protein